MVREFVSYVFIDPFSWIPYVICIHSNGKLLVKKKDKHEY